MFLGVHRYEIHGGLTYTIPHSNRGGLLYILPSYSPSYEDYEVPYYVAFSVNLHNNEFTISRASVDANATILLNKDSTLGAYILFIPMVMF